MPAPPPDPPHETHVPRKPGAARRLVIDHLGAQGDGRAREDGGWLSVAYTLPGEVVEAVGAGERAALVRILEPSPERAEPLCRHFWRCGGCQLQHLSPTPYAAFKRELVVWALAARGLAAEVAETWVTPAGSRRRAALAARRVGREVRLGFHAARSHELVALEECPVMRPAMAAALPRLKAIAAGLITGPETISLLMTETDSGLDLSVSGLSKTLKPLARAEGVAAALQAGFARVSIEGGDMLTARRPQIRLGKAALLPPPGGFLQASAEAEAEMARLVGGHLAGAGEVADLFAGAGTFALRLAEVSSVHAYEGDAGAVEALKEAARGAGGLKPVSAARRDLFRNPLAALELSRIDGVVLDPPRAGAAAQAAELARSRVPKAAYVSCDPATLARDLRTLVDGGYRIASIHPIDQFLWSQHVEAVALLEKDR
ncbi:class I SAM-dependent RNA methyltransferase [Hyphomonas sp.]|uniref:class I SAM-dependent RNA methyltransferase n=1 Tax=Hyphomonas sp. TaxID=87 RepID=UPI00391BEEF0